MKQFEDAIRRHLEELAERDELFRAASILIGFLRDRMR